MFEKEIKYVNLILEKLNPSKVPTSKLLNFKTYMAYTSGLHERFNEYSKKLNSLVTDNLWVETNLNCFLKALKNYQNKKLRILELGSYHGCSAFFFLDYLKKSTITCVDAYKFRHKKHISYFKKNLKKFHSLRRVRLHNNTTLEFFVKYSKKNFYDICYVDAGHGFIDATVDLLLSFDQIKLNGLLIIDDYRWYGGHKVSLDKSVRLAINNFLKINRANYEV